MNFRHEYKHEINQLDLLTLRMRLAAVMKKDSHVVGDKYEIRSLYFDTPEDKALQEKINGVNFREKFRIRYYNGDTSYISLEKKSKINGLCLKESARITKEEAQKIVDGDIAWMLESDNLLCQELYSKMNFQRLRPRTIVDYTREPFTYPAGNVRVTIDYDIRTGDFRTDFLNPDSITLPTGESPIILEVKWDEYLPDIIKQVVSLPNRHASAFSKYERCRIYG